MFAVIVGFQIPSEWLKLLFLTLYVGGVLVLVMFSVLTSRFNKISLSPLALLLILILLDTPVTNYYVGENLTELMLIGLLCVLLFCLFLVMALFKFKRKKKWFVSPFKV